MKIAGMDLKNCSIPIFVIIYL